MKIPLGDFGFRTGDLAPAPSVGPQAFVTPGLSDIGDGVAKVGEVGGHIAAQKSQDAYTEAERLRHKQEAEAKHREAEARAESKHLEAEARHTEAVKITGMTQNALMDRHSALRNGIIDGTVDPSKAGKFWQEQSTEALDATLKNVDPRIAERVRAGLVDNVGTLGRNLGDAVTERRRSDIRSNINDSIEQMDRLWLKDSKQARAQGLLILDANGPAAGMAPADIGKAKQAFIERGNFNAAVQFLNGNRSSAKGLKTFLDAIDKNDEIDPQKKNILIGQAQGYLGHIEARALRAESSRMAGLEHGIKAMDSMILKGYEPTPQQLSGLAAQAKGTAYADVVTQQIQFSAQIAQFRSAVPLQREAYLAKYEAQVRSEPTPDGIKTLERMKQIDKSLRAEVKVNPVSFGQRNGESLPPIDFAKFDTIGEQIAARVPFLRGMKTTQRSEMLPLSDDEAQKMADGLKGLQPKQKSLMLQSLTAKIGDLETVRGMASQIAPKDPDLAAGMLLASRGYSTTDSGFLNRTPGRMVAELYFNGQQALKDKTAKLDDKAVTGVRAQIAEELRGVYATPEGTDLALHTAMNVYAGMAAEGKENLTRAVNITTGGIATHNGGKIAKPYGYSDSMFNDALANITVADLVKAGGGDKFRVGKIELTAAQLHQQLPGAKLQTVDDGLYAIVSDAGYVRRADGKPLTIKVR